VASYHDTALGRRRVEHHDHAVASGKHAAANMTGARRPYLHIPMFWSDLGSIAYEAVGIIDSKLKTVGIWEKPLEFQISESTSPSSTTTADAAATSSESPTTAEIPPTSPSTTKELSNWIPPVAAGELTPYNRGVVYYINNDEVVVGAVLWNVFGKTDDARRAIRRGKPLSGVNEVKVLVSLEKEEHQ